ncbi:MAG: DUF4836 family protein [Prevotellaceae bacterium]|jgi:hypothetical protein|nr:DUF4836 family protein [Prevotellaceae bacterium]
MKTIKFSIIIALFSVIVCGCSKKSATTYPHLVAVPQNAAIVLSLNAKQIVEKAGLDNMEQYKCNPLIQKEIENEPAEERKIMKDFMKDTRTSGLNLDNIFFYLLNGNNAAYDDVPNFSFGVTFKIDNVKTFESFLEKVNLSYDAEDKKVYLDNGISLQWNDEIAIITNADENGTDIFNKDESKSILANELFKNEYSDKNDVYLYGEYNFLINIAETMSYYAGYGADQAALSELDLYKDMSLSISLNAEKGEFVATGKMLPVEKTAEIFGKFYKSDFNNDLYKYISDKSLIALKCAIKPLDIYNYYKKTLGIGQTEESTETTTEEVEVLDEDGNVIDKEEVIVDKYRGYTSNYNLAMKMMVEQYDAKITSVLENFTGDFIGSLSGLTNFSPDFAVAAGIVEGKENDVTALIEQAGFVKNTDGYYLKNINTINLYFAVNKNAACLAGTPEAIANFLDNGYSSDITSAKDFGEELKDASSYFYLNLNINDYPSILKVMLGMSSEGKMAMPLLEKLKSINGSATKTNGFELKLKFTENDYASKILLKGIDELLSQYLELK